MKIWQFVGIEILLIIGMIVVSGCTSSDYSSSPSTPTTVGVTTLTPATTPVQYPTLSTTPKTTDWGRCTCTVYPGTTVYAGTLACHYSDGTTVSSLSLEEGTGKDLDPFTFQRTCTYNGGSTCTCTEGGRSTCIEGTCNCAPETCTYTEGSTRTCTRGACTCTPGTCTFKGGGTCTCTPESCTCTDWDTCTCTQSINSPPQISSPGSCHCWENPCTCNRDPRTH